MIKRQWLHDAAKFGAGLIVADFITHWWLALQGSLPGNFLGLPITSSMLVSGMVVDFFIFLMLVHYGWNIGQIPRMKERVYLSVAGIIFTLVAGTHFVRILYAGDIVFFGWTVPLFLSWIGVAAAAYLAYSSFHLAGRMSR